MPVLKQKITAYLTLSALVLGLFVIPSNKPKFVPKEALVTSAASIVVVQQPETVSELQIRGTSSAQICEVSVPANQSLNTSLGVNTQISNLLNSPANCFNLVPAKIAVQQDLQIAQLEQVANIFVAKELPTNFGSKVVTSSVPTQAQLILVSAFITGLVLGERGRSKLRGKINRFNRNLPRFNSLSLSQLQIMRC